MCSAIDFLLLEFFMFSCFFGEKFNELSAAASERRELNQNTYYESWNNELEMDTANKERMRMKKA
jgi:hypothetical protein